jgi:Tol biopolymer transport system component
MYVLTITQVADCRGSGWGIACCAVVSTNGVTMSCLRFPSLIVSLLPLMVGACSRTSQPGGTSRAEAAGLTQLAEAPAIRRVWKGPSVDFEGRPSPDGRFISTTDWGTGDLGLRDLVADTTRRLTNKGSWGQSSDFAEASAITPDGKSVVFGWFQMKTLNFELRIAPISGVNSASVKTLVSSPEIGFFSPQSFTPDGQSVAAILFRSDRTTQIAMIPLDGRPLRVLKSFDWRSPGDLSISPDGRWLAYDFPRDQGDPERDVYVMAIDGSGETAVLRDKGNDVVAGWTVDGSHLLVGSARSGTPGVWALAMTNGKAQGEPVLVRADVWRMIPLGTSNDGSIFYALQTGQRDLYTAAFDAKSGKVTSQPNSVSGGAFNASPYTMAFSPDGHHVAYIVSRGSSSNPYSQADLVIRSLERGDVRRIAPDLSQISRVYWMPDGRSLLVRGVNQKGRVGLYRVALESGAVTTVYQPTANFSQGVAIAPDASRAYFAAPDSTFTTYTINGVDLANGAVRKIHTLPRGHVFTGIALSPDGRKVAVAHKMRTPGTSSIDVVSIEDGTSNELHRLPSSDELPFYPGLAWSPDGAHVYFGAAGNLSSGVAVPDVEMRRVPAAGGAAEAIDLKRVGLSAFQISPDGRSIAYGLSDFAGEVWVMSPPKPSAGNRAAGGIR